MPSGGAFGGERSRSVGSSRAEHAAASGAPPLHDRAPNCAVCPLRAVRGKAGCDGRARGRGWEVCACFPRGAGLRKRNPRGPGGICARSSNLCGADGHPEPHPNNARSIPPPLVVHLTSPHAQCSAPTLEPVLTPASGPDKSTPPMPSPVDSLLPARICVDCKCVYHVHDCGRRLQAGACVRGCASAAALASV